MTPEQLMQVWAATYAAEYVRLDAAPRSFANAADLAASTADCAVQDLQRSKRTPTFEGNEKL